MFRDKGVCPPQTIQSREKSPRMVVREGQAWFQALISREAAVMTAAFAEALGLMAMVRSPRQTATVTAYTSHCTATSLGEPHRLLPAMLFVFLLV